LTEGELVTITVSDSKIKWKENFKSIRFNGKDIKLKFELREAKIFSFSFPHKTQNLK